MEDSSPSKRGKGNGKKKARKKRITQTKQLAASHEKMVKFLCVACATLFFYLIEFRTPKNNRKGTMYQVDWGEASEPQKLPFLTYQIK